MVPFTGPRRGDGALHGSGTGTPPTACGTGVGTGRTVGAWAAEVDGCDAVVGGSEPGVPGYWAFSVDIARAWEATQAEADTPRNRKVAMRTLMVMSPDRGSLFDVLLRMVRLGIGGPVAGGAQYVSWIHYHDDVRAVTFLLDRDDLDGR